MHVVERYVERCVCVCVFLIECVCVSDRVCVCVCDRAITQPYGSYILFIHQTGRMSLGLGCVVYCWVDPVVVDHPGNRRVYRTPLVAETTRKEPEGARSGVPKKELEKDK